MSIPHWYEIFDALVITLSAYTVHIMTFKHIALHVCIHIELSYLSRIVKKRIFAYAKTKAQISFAVTAKLISAFVFATRIVQFLFY